MANSPKIYVAGHSGLVGSAILRRLRAKGQSNLAFRSRAELDLTDGHRVREFFEAERPDLVYVAAAKVGGILANKTYPADFIYQNLEIATNVLHEAWRTGVRRLLYLGSVCIYPKVTPLPIREEYLLTGPLEPTNRPYAISKIAGIELCWSYNRQSGTRFLAVMPTNLYGPGDNYDLQNSHVLPALIRKMHEAKARGEKRVVLWGTGNPTREFLYSDDLADACIFLMNLPDERWNDFMREDEPPLINVGAGANITIRDLAHLVGEAVGFDGQIEWDTSRPDGTPQRLLDTSKMSALGWAPKIGLREGIRLAYRDFLTRFAH
jgi:GDP-L-fucose synthase